MSNHSDMVTDTMCVSEPRKVDPASILNDTDISELRKAYGLSTSLVFRRPLRSERARDNHPDEIVVYEAHFIWGFRGIIPSLVIKMANHFSISPGQFTPSAWMLLTAIQTFGEFESISIGVEEVLFAYYFLQYAPDLGRYAMHTRSHCPLVIDFDVKVKRTFFEDWRNRYFFMKVGPNSKFSTEWFLADVRTKGPEAGRVGAGLVTSYPEAHRSVEFLTSSFALKNCTIWRTNMTSQQREPLISAYDKCMAAPKKLSENHRIDSNITLTDSGEDIQCTAAPTDYKRTAIGDLASSSAARRPRISRDNEPTLSMIHHSVTSTEATPFTAVDKLKSKLLTYDFNSLIIDGTARNRDDLYSNLLRAMLAFQSVNTTLSSANDDVAYERRVSSDLRLELENEKKQRSSALLELATKDTDILCLRQTMRQHDATIANLQAEISKLTTDNDLLTEENAVLREKSDGAKYEIDFYLSGAAFIAR